jgi:hypothetical protein
MRRCFVSLLLVVLVCVGVAVGQNPPKPAVADQALTRSIDQVLKDVSSVQAGMSRADLLRVFTTEGGISTRDEQRYVYRRCPYIKVRVNFRRPADADDDWGGASEAEWTGDIIQSISKPFLEYPIAD